MEDIRGRGRGEAELLCTTCFTCKASGAPPSIIMTSRAQSETREFGHGMVSVSLSKPELAPFPKQRKNRGGGEEKSPSKLPAAAFFIPSSFSNNS